MTFETPFPHRRATLAGMLAAVAAPSAHSSTRRTWDDVRGIVSAYQTTAVVVTVGEDEVWRYGDVTEVSYLASARKSLVSMLYGPAVARGTIDLGATLAELGVDDQGGLLPIERAATLRDLLSARSGIYHPAANAGDASALAPPRGSVQPGSYFLYNNWDFNALGGVYERVTGRNLYQAFTEDLAAPLGLEDWRADLQQTRNDTGLSRFPAHHFALSCRDMSRLGRLMLAQGRWQGERILAREWVRRSTAAITPAADVARTSPFIDGLGYGRLWWVFDGPRWPSVLRGAYTASGAFGQFITIVPRADAVIAHKTAVPPQRNVRAEDYFETILPAILSAL